MNKTLELVKEFHETFEHPIGKDSSHNEDLKIRQLRIKLLFEELAELAKASDCKRTMHILCNNYVVDEEFDSIGGEPIEDGDNVDKKEELDALCDIQYVLSGKILTAGLHDVFDHNFVIVHENNMRKAHKSRAHCLETIREKLKKGGASEDKYTILEKNGHFLLFDENGKLTKPFDHTKVKLKL